MLDGQYGGLIVRDPPSRDPHYQSYDKDYIIIFLSDWMHVLSLERYPGSYRRDPGQAPQNILINGLGNWTVNYMYIFTAKIFFYIILSKDRKTLSIRRLNGKFRIETISSFLFANTIRQKQIINY